MTPSKIFFCFCLSFIGGIFISSFFFVSQPVLLALLILGILLISVFWHYKKFVVIGFSILFLIAGIWRYQVAGLRIINDEIRKYNDSKENITLIGTVSNEPDLGERSQKLTLKIEQIITEKEIIKETGKVLLTTWRYPEYKYGDKLKITGKLETPPVFEEFNYQEYLKKDGIYSLIYFPEIKLLGQNYGNPLKAILFSFKNKFQETSRKFLSPPQEGILEALIFGEEENISQEWKDKLNLTGTRHITAVSGMNVTIITFLIFNFLLLLGFWRHQAFYLSIILIILYILMIGGPASGVRAGIMGILLITAQHFGRISQAQRAVTFAAAFMLFLNPLLLRLDIGFQLSFLAILGLIYFQPFFFDFLKKIPNSDFFSIRTTLSTTIAAQIFTLPILVYNFGRIPLLSLITNVLIVPILAPLTILIFIFGILGMISWFLGFLLSFPIWLSLIYITKIVDLFSKISFVSLTFENVHWFWLIISYLILGFLTWRLQEKQKLKFLNY